MQKPFFSIVVVSLNPGERLEKTLDSIVKQTYTNYEVIVVDDGSTDDSLAMTQKFIDERLEGKGRVIHKENGGVSSARNLGLKNAKGKYIFFIDSDDYIEKDLFNSVNKYIDQNVDLIKFKCIRVNEDNEIIEKVEGPNFEIIDGQEAFNILYDKLYKSFANRQFDIYALSTLKNYMYNCRLSFKLRDAKYTFEQLCMDMTEIETIQAETQVRNFYPYRKAIIWLFNMIREDMSNKKSDRGALNDMVQFLEKCIYRFEEAIKWCERNRFYPVQNMYRAEQKQRYSLHQCCQPLRRMCSLYRHRPL